MSRCSLRLNEGLPERSLPHGSASFSMGGVSRRSSWAVRSPHSQWHLASCSESLHRTPRKAADYSVASDASLISSLLDESSMQESTLVNTFWGLDQDVDPKESDVIVSEENCTRIGSDIRCAKHLDQNISTIYCKDCSIQSKLKASAETSIIYCRDRKRSSRTDVLQLWLSSCLLCVRRAAACCFSALQLTWQACRASDVDTQPDSGEARSSRCGAMSLKEHQPIGSLCDDCKEKQRSKLDTVSSSSSSSSSWSSVASCFLGFLCSAAVFTASRLLQFSQRAAAALWPLIRIFFWAAVRSGRSAGRSAGDTFWWFYKRLSHMTTRFFLGLLIILLPLLFIFSLCWFSPAGFCSALPDINLTAWTMAVDDVPGLSFVHSYLFAQSQSAEDVVEELSEESLRSLPPAAGTPPPPQVISQEVPAAVDSERLVQVEQSLMALWEQVEAAGQRAEQRHKEVLQLYSDLQQQQPSSPQSGGDGVEPWISGLMDQQLVQLRRRLDEDRRRREQIRQQDLLLLKTQMTRLDQLELQLQNVATRTLDVQQMQETTTTLPAALSIGVDRHSHDALQAEVLQLGAALGDIRQDVQVLSECRNDCQQLDRIQQMISEHVSILVRDLIYGSQQTPGGDDDDLQESLLQLLSQRFISEADLQEALTSLELNILQNISRRLQLQGKETIQEAFQHAVRNTGNAGNTVTKEDVYVMVTDALRLFSQDRIGLADYALESGGGSVLSTRCSETYETKAALLSLFGVPLWYFSQSPRAVIQPDIHPGNCWAFKGSTGFLVIRLSMSILPTAVTMQHIPKALAPSGTLRSAPRDFSVYGLRDESQEEGKLLGNYIYEEDGEDLQMFIVSEENDESFQIIEVQVLSNWGHPEYTCLYRFRVHGTPSDV